MAYYLREHNGPVESTLVLSSQHLVGAMDAQLVQSLWLIVTALALLPACDDSKPKGVVYTL